MGRRRGTGERGAALVEAAIIFPLLLLVLFGTIEFGLAFKDALTVSSATGTAARTATVVPLDPGSATSLAAATALGPLAAPEFLTIYKPAPGGDLPVSGTVMTCTDDCLRYTWDGDAWAAVPGLIWTAPTCGTTAESVGVFIQARHDFITGLFGRSKTLSDRTVMRFEPC